MVDFKLYLELKSSPFFALEAWYLSEFIRVLEGTAVGIQLNTSTPEIL